MTKIYKRKCNYCNKYYEGYGKFFCSRKCAIIGQIHKGFKKGENIGNKFAKGNKPNKTSFKIDSKINIGRKHSKEWIAKTTRKGFKTSKETRKKQSEALKGEKCYLWKGGITSKNLTIRRGVEARLWRESVFTRDNWMCQNCGKRNGKNVGKTVCINAHHILNFAEYPELRFAIDNGITLCKKCHLKFHKKYGFKNNTKEQLNEFLRTGDAPTANTTTIGSLFVKYTA